MTTAAQVQQEIIDWYNKLIEGNEYHEQTEYLDTAIDSFTDSIDTYGAGDVVLPSGQVEQVAQHGGEGEGDEYWVVFSVGDQLFRVEGYYSSWNGTDWENVEVEEVEAYEVSVTQYKKKES